MASKDQKNTLFVRNLPPTATKSDLDSHFGGVGPLRHTTVVTEPGTEKCKGFGFVSFAFHEDAENALKSLDGSCIRGRKISLDVAKKRQRREENDIETAVPHEKRKREPVKRIGAKKGSLAMRTVLLTTTEKDGQLTEEDAKQAVGADKPDAGFESCIMSADSREARCTFSSWALAGLAAAAAHGSKYNAVIEAVRGGKRTRLIVRNLPFLVDQTELRSRFQNIAPLRELRLAPANVLRVGDSKQAKSVTSAVEKEVEEDGKNTGNQVGSPKIRCGGYAFVEYFLVADAKFAIAKLNGTKIGGRIIAVDLAIGKTAYEAQEQDDSNGKESDAAEDNGKEAIDNASHDTDADESDSAHEQGDDITVEPSRKGRNAVSNDDDTKPNKKSAASTEVELFRTVFVRNLLFETSAPELWKAMEDEFGKVEQAVLVTHPVTKRPRGTAFVRFASTSSAKKAVEQAGAGDTTKQESGNDSDLAAKPKPYGFALQGRQLMISQAVERSRAKDFETGSRKSQNSDPRNLRLAWIGMVKADSPEAKGLSQEDLARRAKAVKEKKVKLERNPNVFVSQVRLCVRNLPKVFDEKLLKHMFLCAAREKAPSKSRKQRPVTAVKSHISTSDKQSEGHEEPHQPHITHVTIARDPQRKDRSKGYGFVQFEKHDDALRALKLINNNPKAMEWLIKQRPKALKIDIHRERLMRKQWDDGRRLMVEFALEDTRKVQILERIKEKGRKLAEEHKRKRSEAPDGGQTGGKRKKRKSDRVDDNMTSTGKSHSSSQRMSKSEKRAALKRERATAANRNREKKNHEKQDPDAQCGDTETTRGRGRRTPDAKASSRRHIRHEAFESIKAAERPDPKPKKSKKKRKAAELEEDNKFDRLLLTYKQKLAKTGTAMPQQTENRTNNALSVKPRWFE